MSKSGQHLSLCRYEGNLVGSGYWIPDASFDFWAEGTWPVVGCNQVFCSSCQQIVRQRLGFQLDTYSRVNPEKRAKVLFCTENWDELDFLKPSKIGVERIYYCFCDYFPESNKTSLDGTSDHLIYGAMQPESWKCKGHPALTPPTEVYGLPLNSAADAAKIVNAVLNHTAKISDPLPKDEANPEAFLISRLYMFLEPGQYRREIDGLLSDFLTHPDSLNRSVACNLIEKFPFSEAATALVKSYRSAPNQYDNVKHPHHDRGTYPLLRDKLIGLDQQFQSALLNHLALSKDPEVQALARELILAKKMKFRWGGFSNVLGPDWIEEHFMEIYSADPKGSLFSLLSAIVDREPGAIMDRINELKATKLLEEKEFLVEIPYDVKRKVKDLLTPDTHDPKSRKKQRRK